MVYRFVSFILVGASMASGMEEEKDHFNSYYVKHCNVFRQLKEGIPVMDDYLRTTHEIKFILQNANSEESYTLRLSKPNYNFKLLTCEEDIGLLSLISDPIPNPKSGPQYVIRSSTFGSVTVPTVPFYSGNLEFSMPEKRTKQMLTQEIVVLDPEEDSHLSPKVTATVYINGDTSVARQKISFIQPKQEIVFNIDNSILENYKYALTLPQMISLENW